MMAPKAAVPKLRVATKADGTFGKFIVRDEEDAEYGPSAKTREEANEILQDWRAYYSSPIPA